MDTRIRNRHPSPRGSTRRKRKPPKHFRKTAQIPDTPPAWTLSQWQVSWLTGRNLKTPSRSVCFSHRQYKITMISYRCARPVALCFQALRSQLRGQPRMRTVPYRVPFSSRRKTGKEPSHLCYPARHGLSQWATFQSGNQCRCVTRSLYR